LTKIPRATALIEHSLAPEEPSPTLALAAGSHTGTDMHLAALSRMATDLEVDIASLRTSVRRRLGSSHLPFTADKDEQRVHLQNECSGEHIGALALARKFGDDDYLSTSSAVQATYRSLVEKFAAGAVHAEARDHCGMPSVRASLTSVATGFARLSEGMGNAGSSLTGSISKFAELYAGTGQYSTELVKASRGAVIAKGGLGGSYGLWWPDLGVGAAIRISGGEHAAAAVVLPHLAVEANVPYPADPPEYCFDDGTVSQLRFAAVESLEHARGG
jgi:L-asparaginase II